MRHGEQHAPRYLRATLLTVAVVSILPVVLLAAGLHAYHSPDWDPQGDSGAVQGLALFGFIAAAAIAFTASVFPAAGAVIWKQGRFRTSDFYKILSAWLAALALVGGLAISLLSGSLLMAFPLILLIFFLVALFSFPFAKLWMWLAS
jgi:hypothetical protein